jgi:vitellogenic carboxypeptidase-like protein
VHLNSTYNYDGVVRSGYLKVGAGNSVLGLLLYGKLGEKESALKEFPTIMVLGGGPGSSSQLINFHQIGPLTFRTSSPSLNNLTWANNYNLLFVDQPIGTGLSYADKDAEPTTLEGTSSPI